MLCRSFLSCGGIAVGAVFPVVGPGYEAGGAECGGEGYGFPRLRSLGTAQ